MALNVILKHLCGSVTPKSPESQHQAVLNFIDVIEPWPQEMTFNERTFQFLMCSPNKGGGSGSFF